MLAADDATPTFQPNLRKANVALSCELDAVVDCALRAYIGYCCGQACKRTAGRAPG